MPSFNIVFRIILYHIPYMCVNSVFTQNIDIEPPFIVTELTNMARYTPNVHLKYIDLKREMWYHISTIQTGDIKYGRKQRI